MKRFLYLVLIPLLFGCAANNQIWFGDRNNSSVDNNNVVKVFIDKRGNLYPDSNIIIPKNKFIYGYRANENNANLKSYFLHDKENSRIIQLANYYKVPLQENQEELFKNIQEEILKKIAANVSHIKKEKQTDELVIFIHGYNMEYPAPVYYQFRKYIDNYKTDKKRVFLEIYWDGLTDKNNDIAALKIWTFAQVNSSYVANAVRKIINKIDYNTKIRIITHSLGASVGTGALFNTSSKWPVTQGQNFYEEMMNIPAPGHKDIRIGMIAPAIPGVNTFVDFNRRNGNSTIRSNDNNISKVVIGYKEKDEALLKKALNNSNNFGATTLGANTLNKETGKREIERVEEYMLKELQYTENNTPIRAIDFKDDIYSKEHGWYYYLQNKYALDRFLNQLFD
ncbi:alpha/beta hydrolase [Empedobacter brevis]|uniref:alpha/beta hydrolase n=1 Tax=Empedobacter brevis TaxID=247 RepID=UPI00123C85EF|nr:alpha/beta hydrolase [Empedobacter brevis]QES93596.1 alpha/beta hydrolase [Empedobacter brevis]